MKKTYTTPEIHCHSCAGLIKDTLDGVSGVGDVSVDVGAKTVTVDYTDETAEPKVIEMLGEEGYSARPA
jgi:copper chaperone CopZ